MERKDFIIIVACAENGVIGNMGNIPWHISEDFKRFKELTTGHTLIMGAKTFTSIGKPLPNRRNIIVTHGHNLLPAGEFEIALSIEEAVKLAGNDEKVFICGGESIYKQFLDNEMCDTVYLTVVKGNFDGDKVFPMLSIEVNTSWKLTHEEDRGTHVYKNYSKTY